MRWFDPLDDGRVTPIRPGTKNTLALPHQQTVKPPSGELRWLSPVTPRSTVYTARMKAEHVARVRRSRYARPTASADDDFVVGHSRGTEAPEWIYKAAHVPPILDAADTPATDIAIPPQPLFGYCITDPEAEGDKRIIVMTAGNHTEPTGCRSLHAAIEFLLSDDPRAARMRREAEFYVYPLVNPEGRVVLSRVQSPELLAAGWQNHNRVWTTAGILSTIDILTAAMRYDTRCRVDYLIDFHSGAAHSMYLPSELVDSAFVRAIVAREGISTAGPGAMGTTIHFAMHEDGLRSTRGYTTENDDWKTFDHCIQVGRNYALTLYDILSGHFDDRGEHAKNFRFPLASGSPPPLRQRDASKLLEAVARGNLDTAQERVASGDDINGKNSAGNTALHLAAEQGQVDIARWLIGNGAGVSSTNLRGWTPLHYAVRYGNADIAALLLEREADINARTLDVDTPLHLAAMYNRPEIARALLAAGADATLPGGWGRTPSDWARRLGHAGILGMLE